MSLQGHIGGTAGCSCLVETRMPPALPDAAPCCAWAPSPRVAAAPRARVATMQMAITCWVGIHCGQPGTLRLPITTVAPNT